MNQNQDAGPAPPPYPRESGVLVLIDERGSELRLHRLDSGVWLAHRWREDDCGREICAVAWGLTAWEWAEAGRVAAGLVAAVESAAP